MKKLAPVLLMAILRTTPVTATTVPTGYVHEQVVGNPFGQSPVAFDFLPDGRFLLAEQATGTIRVAAASSSVSDSVHTIADVRADHPERGLLGIATDPDWPDRPHVYAHFTATDSTVKIVRLTASGALSDAGSTALSFSDRYEVLADLDDDAGIHNAGTIRFAADGTLLVSVGDDSKACQAQDLTSPLGKILRLDVSSLPAGPGGPPALTALDPGDNPFPGGSGYQPLVLAWGLRNPFRFTVDLPTGDVFIGSVGSHLFEEINLVPGPPYPPRNFGWPQFENDAPLFCCGDCGVGNAFTGPIWALPHPLGVVSIVAGALIRPVPASPVSFPASMEGDLLFAEIFSGLLYRIRESGGTWVLPNDLPGQPAPGIFGDGFVGLSDARIGADGALYFVSLGLDTNQLPRGLHRIRADPTFTSTPEPVDRDRLHVRVHPNPGRVHAGATIRYRSSVPGEAVLEVHDVAGRRVGRFRDGHSRPGERTLFLEDSKLGGAGVRFVTVTTPDGLTGRIRVVRLR